MSPDQLIERLERFPKTLAAVVSGLPDADARWRPDGGGWSILEIVTHVADEETDDFRTRLELTLRDPGEAWPPIDPESAAVERRYNEGDLAENLRRFEGQRRGSVQWLRSLNDPPWTNTHHHKLGDITAGDLLASWTAHDVLHLRQIVKRLFQLTERDAGASSTRYAGTWTA